MMADLQLLAAVAKEAEQARLAGDAETAASLYDRAMQLVQQAGVPEQMKAALYSNYGIMLTSMGRHEDAIRLQQAALDIDRRLGSPPRDLGTSHHNLGNALFQGGHREQAVEHLLEAFRIRSQLPNMRELLQTVESLAEQFLEAGDYYGVAALGEEAEKIAQAIGDRKPLRFILMLQARAAVAQNHWDRVPLLLAEIVEMLEALRAQEGEEARLDHFDSRYNRLYLDIIEMCLEGELYEAAFTLIDRTRFRSGCDALEGAFEAGSPFDGPGPAARAQPRELILLEWVYPKFDWSFPLTSGQKRVEARKIVTSRREDPFPDDPAREWKAHFYSTLTRVQRVVDAYENQLDQLDRIIIIPHGLERDTPFAALRHPKTGELLVRTHEVMLSPSLRYIRITDDRPLLDHHGILVVADSQDDLEGAREEATVLSTHAATDVLVSKDATRRAVLERLERRRYDVIHFACHGVFDESGLTALQLRDGELSAEEVRTSQATANVVNLATCWGGRAKFSVWNELDGFLRAFLTNGVRNLIGSSYPLSDKASAAFNRAFYEAYSIRRAAISDAFRGAVRSIPSDLPVEGWGGLYLAGQRPRAPHKTA